MIGVYNRMIKLLKNGRIFSPEYLGQKDILLIKDTIYKIEENIPKPGFSFYDIDIIDLAGKIIVPGFIDSHVHIIGGGGEGGFKTRTPEIQLSQLIKAGITTVVGCLGTDGTSRHMNSLLAKARGLEEEGISTFIYTGSYQFPIQTITGNCRDDIMLIDKVIGVGEVAIADHRSSYPTEEEFKKMVSYARVGGLLSNKSGIINVHMGEGVNGLKFLMDIVDNTEIPISQFLPTHINLNKSLLDQGINFTKAGGIIDLTTSSNNDREEEIKLAAGNTVKYLIDKGVSPLSITFSSDGNGSLPVFDNDGNYQGLDIGSVSSLFIEVKRAVMENNIDLEDGLKFITSNVAEHLKLEDRGKIEASKRADLVILNKELEIKDIISGGLLMMKDGEVLIKGTFE